MNKSLLAFALALGLSTGLAATARADESTWATPSVPQQTAQMPTRDMEARSIDAYEHNVNPLARGGLEKTGPYDIADLFVGTDGYPLPGWAAIGFGSEAGGGDE